MGLSQGALLARYVATNCKLNGTVRNLASIGGPNMGVADIPDCQTGIFCEMVNFVVRNMVYFQIFQNIIGPAGYFRDPKHMTEYLADSAFLPYVNNEKGDADTMAAIKARFTSLNNVLLMKFNEDMVVYPRESEWFWQLDNDFNVVQLEDTTFYTEDWIGLKQMNEAGKVIFSGVEGDHLQFTEEDIETIIVPFLLS
jgi:palmitoyl-protein thioesterase